VNKDGTTRYDMSELPITHFKPMEVGVSVQRLVELGYLFDIDKQPLVNDQQIVELKPQDLILPASPDALDEPADTVLFRVASFIDEELTQLYGLPSFYNLRSKADLVGHLVIGLAPHISAGIIGRIIGFSKTQGMYCHPLYHAAMRRDCDGDEACVILLLDAFLNFSRQYLPDKRGGRTMDSPLVLTTTITPSEVDDQAHGVERPAVASVAVDDQRQIRGARHHAGDEGELLERQDAEVGQTERRRHRAAGYVKRLEPLPLGEDAG